MQFLLFFAYLRDLEEEEEERIPSPEIPVFPVPP